MSDDSIWSGRLQLACVVEEAPPRGAVTVGRLRDGESTTALTE
jgi:hypothetical protein